MTKLNILQAVNRTLHEEMQRDDGVVVLGEEIEQGGIFRATEGLLSKFGHDRDAHEVPPVAGPRLTSHRAPPIHAEELEKPRNAGTKKDASTNARDRSRRRLRDVLLARTTHGMGEELVAPAR